MTCPDGSLERSLTSVVRISTGLDTTNMTASSLNGVMAPMTVRTIEIFRYEYSMDVSPGGMISQPSLCLSPSPLSGDRVHTQGNPGTSRNDYHVALRSIAVCACSHAGPAVACVRRIGQVPNLTVPAVRVAVNQEQLTGDGGEYHGISSGTADLTDANNRDSRRGIRMHGIECHFCCVQFTPRRPSHAGVVSSILYTPYH